MLMSSICSLGISEEKKKRGEKKGCGHVDKSIDDGYEFGSIKANSKAGEVMS